MKQLIDILRTVYPDELSEEFVTKLTASVETIIANRLDEENEKVKAQADSKIAQLENSLTEQKNDYEAKLTALNEKAEAYADYVVEEMTKRVDDYCNFVVENFIAEHRDQLVDTVTYNRMADTLRIIREAFETNYFPLTNEPASKVLTNQLKEIKEEYNKLFTNYSNLLHENENKEKALVTEQKTRIFEDLTKDLADTQKEKLVTLIEKANFTNLDTYKTGVTMLVEQLKPPAPGVEEKPPVKKENVSTVLNEQQNDKMKTYLQIL